MSEPQTPCRHQYIVGYLARMPQPFFRSLTCDHCGQKIRLSAPRRILFAFIYLFAFVFAYSVASSIHIRLFGSTLLVSMVIFALLNVVVLQVNRLILRYGKWSEVKPK
jgi:hypothetical protein